MRDCSKAKNLISSSSVGCRFYRNFQKLNRASLDIPAPWGREKSKKEILLFQAMVEVKKRVATMR
jgi:hypothetical protein